MKLHKPKTHWLGILAVLLLNAGMTGAQELDDYIGMALKNSPAIKAQGLAYEASMQKIPQVRSWADPQVNASLFINPMMLPMGNQIGNLSVMQMLPRKNEFNIRESLATGQADLNLKEGRILANDLIYQVTTAWYALVANREMQALQQRNMDLLADIKTLAEAQFRQGNASMTDVLRVDVVKDDIQTNLEILADEQSTREKQFNLLLNQDPGTSLKYPDTLEALNAELLPVTTFDGHPQAALLDQRSEVANAIIESTNLSRKPVFGVGLQYTPLYRRKNASFELPPNTGRDMIMPMATVSIPIWRKQYDAAVREQHIAQTQFAEQKEALFLELRKDEEELGYQLEKTRANLLKRDRQYATTRQILDLLMSEYQNGSGTMEELLRVEQQLLNYRLEQIELKMNYYQLEAKRNMLYGNRNYNY